MKIPLLTLLVSSELVLRGAVWINTDTSFSSSCSFSASCPESTRRSGPQEGKKTGPCLVVFQRGQIFGQLISKVLVEFGGNIIVDDQTWNKDHFGIIPLTKHHLRWRRSEVAAIHLHWCNQLETLMQGRKTSLFRVILNHWKNCSFKCSTLRGSNPHPPGPNRHNLRTWIFQQIVRTEPLTLGSKIFFWKNNQCNHLP